MSKKDERKKKLVSIVGGKRDKNKYTVVLQVPSKDNPSDTRLYKGVATSSSPSTAQAYAELDARYKADNTPADSLTRAEFKEFKKIEEPPKKRKKRRKWRNK
jgi:hypothetical protein